MRTVGWLLAHLILVGIGVLMLVLERFAGLELGSWKPTFVTAGTLSGLLACLVPVFGRVPARRTTTAILLALLLGGVSMLLNAHTGMPFGVISHTEAWLPVASMPSGYLFALAAPAAWLLIAAGSFLTVQRMLRPESFVTTALLAALLASILEFAAEPAFVLSLGFWTWLLPEWPIGAISGIPLLNPIGWFFSCAVGGFLFGSLGLQVGASWKSVAALAGFLSLVMTAGALDGHGLPIGGLAITASLLILALVKLPSEAPKRGPA